MASPLPSNNYRYFTWNYIFIRHMICVLLGASCMICVFAWFIFIYTNGSDEGFFEFCAIEVFKFWVILWWMKEGCKSLSLGMPRHPKILSKNEQPTNLGDAPEWHPLFLLTTISISLETIFLFVTWYMFCLERLVWYVSLLVLFCVLSHQYLLDTPIW